MLKKQKELFEIKNCTAKKKTVSMRKKQYSGKQIILAYLHKKGS